MSETKIPQEVIERVVQSLENKGVTQNYEEKLEMALANLQLYYSQILPRMLDKESLSVPEVVELLVDSCMVAQNLEEGLIIFLRHIQKEGLEIEFDAPLYRNWARKLTMLRMFSKMVHASGLGAFETRLMDLEIDKHFAANPAGLPAGRGTTSANRKK